MKVKNIYPTVQKQKIKRREWMAILRGPFLLVAFACPIINIAVGGRAWSVLALLGLYLVWRLLISPDLVEYNRISQFIKVLVGVCILLILINVLFEYKWGFFVIPIVCFSGLVISAVLFFTDFQKQKQNMLPMFTLIFASIIGAILGLSVWREETSWVFIVLGSVAVALLVSCMAVLRGDFIREFKKRFHV